MWWENLTKATAIIASLAVYFEKGDWNAHNFKFLFNFNVYFATINAIICVCHEEQWPRCQFEQKTTRICTYLTHNSRKCVAACSTTTTTNMKSLKNVSSLIKWTIKVIFCLFIYSVKKCVYNYIKDCKKKKKKVVLLCLQNK